MFELSVVVPIYDVEAYIRKCLDSLLAQTFKGFEIILVDDGSPDNCPVICDEYAAIDSRIKVIHKKNGGLVSARKAGLDYSTGKYVTFVDGDDWLDLTYIDKCNDIINKYQPDVVSLNAWFLATETEISLSTVGNNYEGVYDRQQLENLVYPNILYSAPFYNFGTAPSLWTKIIRRELLERYMSNMPENIRMGEDLVVSLPCILKANTIYFSNICGYYYRQNPTSITHTFDPMAPERVDSLIRTLEQELECYGNEYHMQDQIAMYAVYITEFSIVSLIKGSRDLKKDLCHFEILWNNATVKRGKKYKIPFRTKVLFAIVKTKQAWLIKLIRRLKYGRELDCVKEQNAKR